MKWKVLLIVALLSLVLMLAITPAHADSSADVTVVATGWVCGAPGGFTITYISDYEVGLSWTKGEDAVNTMVRAAYGRIPENRTDGYMVYYGPEEYCSDTAVNLDETMADIGYAAFSENANGIWADESVSGLLENLAVQQIAGVVLIISIVGLAMWRRGIILFVVGNLACYFFSIRWLGQAWERGGIGWEYGLAAMGLAAFCICMAAVQAFRGNIRA